MGNYRNSWNQHCTKEKIKAIHDHIINNTEYDTLKTKDVNIMLLLGGFVAYSIQAFGNISVIQVAPIYYIIIGLILSQKPLTNK